MFAWAAARLLLVSAPLLVSTAPHSLQPPDVPGGPVHRHVDGMPLGLKESPKPMAILHVGPHKMGSTSVQAALATFHEELTQDGFMVPSISDGYQRLYAAASYLRCPKGEVEPCPHMTCPLKCDDPEVEQGWRNLIIALDTARAEGKGVILSAEDFDRPDVRVKELFDALHGFDVTTVVMYRHYFDWIASVYGHLRSHEVYALECANGIPEGCYGSVGWEERRTNTLEDAAKRYTPLVKWLTKDRLTSYLEIYTADVLQRFAKFGTVDTIMVDARVEGTPEGTLEEAFLCRGGMPNACSAARANPVFVDASGGKRFWRKKGDALVLQNAADTIGALALELAIVASNEGLLPADENAQQAVSRLANHMQSNGAGFVPVHCLANPHGDLLTVADQLWEMTDKAAHKALFVAEKLTGHPLVGLKMPDVKKAYANSTATKLCSVDAKGVRESKHIRGLLHKLFPESTAQSRQPGTQRAAPAAEPAAEPAPTAAPTAVPTAAPTAAPKAAPKAERTAAPIEGEEMQSTQASEREGEEMKMHHIRGCLSCGVDWCAKVAQGECVNFVPDDGTHILGADLEKVGCDHLASKTPYCMTDTAGIYAITKQPHPEAKATTPKPEATTPKPEATTPKPEATTSEPEATISKPEPTTPEPAAPAARKDERVVRVISVHVGEKDWVPMQASMLALHIDLPFRLYTTVNDGQGEYVSDTWKRLTGNGPALATQYSAVMQAASKHSWKDRCVLGSDESCEHAVQLEYLIHKATEDATADDILFVLDSDAWPVGSLSQDVLPLMGGDDGVELVAVQRSAEGMSLWPHPSYAVTTFGAWSGSYHSWGLAPQLVGRGEFRRNLQDQIGSATKHMQPLCHDHPFDLDTGSVLWASYNDSLSNWIALPRMNAMNLDPLFFGVYGHNGVALAYYEGAGMKGAGAAKRAQPKDDTAHAARDAVGAARDEVLGLVRARYQYKRLVLPVTNDGNLSAACVSIQPGTSDVWCSTTCAKAPRVPGEKVCPDDICRCKLEAGAESNAKALDMPDDHQAEAAQLSSGMEQLLELLLHPDTSPLRKSDLVDRCEATRKQFLNPKRFISARESDASPECREVLVNLCGPVTP